MIKTANDSKIFIKESEFIVFNFYYDNLFRNINGASFMGTTQLNLTMRNIHKLDQLVVKRVVKLH